MLLYLNTARHLRREQLKHFVLRRSARVLGLRRPRQVPYDIAHDYLVSTRASMLASLCNDPGLVMRSADAVLAGRFEFLNVCREIDIPDWRMRHGTPLWSFQLQYCRYVEDLAWAYVWTGHVNYRERLEALVLSWVDAQKPLASDAWAPFAVAQRLMHWSRAFLLVHPALSSDVASRWLASIAVQTDYLSRNIEWDLLGNHVHQNLCGIVAAASLFSNQRLIVLRENAARLLWNQLEEQVLSDGLHSERSPMYHADVLANTIDAEATAVASGLPVPEHVRHHIAMMQRSLVPLVRQNGTYHLFNDAANDARHSTAHRAIDQDHASIGTWSLPASGYFGYTSSALRFLIDCGDPGPRHQAGHGHCDLLSFELDINGAPLIVDSGTSGYDQDPLREYMRSTRAHNTVQIGNQEQHEVWGTFRVGRRATVRSARIDPGREARFEGSYSPYYSNRIEHKRTVTLRPDTVTVQDVVAGADGRPVLSFLHLHPSTDVKVNGTSAIATLAGASATIELHNSCIARVVHGGRAPYQGWYAPEFGVRLTAPVLEMTPENPERPFGYTITVNVPA